MIQALLRHLLVVLGVELFLNLFLLANSEFRLELGDLRHHFDQKVVFLDDFDDLSQNLFKVLAASKGTQSSQHRQYCTLENFFLAHATNLKVAFLINANAFAFLALIILAIHHFVFIFLDRKLQQVNQCLVLIDALPMQSLLLSSFLIHHLTRSINHQSLLFLPICKESVVDNQVFKLDEVPSLDDKRSVQP